MPASLSARSSSNPAGPTKGEPARSSRSPGCSPTNMICEPARPSPKTVWVPVFHKSHALQPEAAARSAGSVGFGGMSGWAVPDLALPCSAFTSPLCLRAILAGERGIDRHPIRPCQMIHTRQRLLEVASPGDHQGAGPPRAELHLPIEAKGEEGTEFGCDECDRDKYLVGITTSTSVPGLALARRNSPPNSLTLCRIPPIPIPMLPGRNSITLSSTPLPSSRIVTVN